MIIKLLTAVKQTTLPSHIYHLKAGVLLVPRTRHPRNPLRKMEDHFPGQFSSSLGA